MRRFVWLMWIAVLPLFAVPAALAQSRTPWQMHDGVEVTAENPDGLIQFSCSPTQHGDPCEYEVATIPPADHAGWGPAPNGESIGFSIPSRVCRAPIQCMAYGDFTYFQTFVDIPAAVEITTFTIDFNGMDDGCRVTIFNSLYPQGLVVPGSYVFLGGSGTTNLKELVVAGEVNRVVITQVDDCCSANNLQSAVVVLNGTTIGTNQPPVCDAGGPYAIESPATQVTLDGTGSSDPEGASVTYQWTSDCPGAVFDDPTLASPVLTITPAGEEDIDCTVTLTVSDGEEGASCSAPVHFEAPAPNQPPVCDAGGPYTIESPTTTVTLDGTGSSDPEGASVTYQWTSDCPGAVFDDPTLASPVLTITLPEQGGVDCSVTLTVGDGEESASCSALVHLEGPTTNMPPDCSQATATMDLLWPPDHTYRAVGVLGVTDPDGDPVTVTVTGITQDEPVNGKGDGDASPDARIEDGQASVRAERSGTRGNGRVYVLRFTASDGRGGACEGTVSVCVPHDRGHATCVDDGQLYVSTEESGDGGSPLGATARLAVAHVNGATADIRFELAGDGPVNLSVYDVLGRHVATLEDGAMPSGSYARVWNMSGVARGLYFVRLRAGGATVTERVLKLQE